MGWTGGPDLGADAGEESEDEGVESVLKARNPKSFMKYAADSRCAGSLVFFYPITNPKWCNFDLTKHGLLHELLQGARHGREGVARPGLHALNDHQDYRPVRGRAAHQHSRY